MEVRLENESATNQKTVAPEVSQEESKMSRNYGAKGEWSIWVALTIAAVSQLFPLTVVALKYLFGINQILGITL